MFTRCRVNVISSLHVIRVWENVFAELERRLSGCHTTEQVSPTLVPGERLLPMVLWALAVSL